MLVHPRQLEDPIPPATEKYRGKVALVTGGARGLGAACALYFVRSGANVCFCDKIESQGRAKEAELNEAGPGSAAFFLCDVTDEKQVEACVQFAEQRFGRLDCLVNNVGWHPPFKTIDEFSADEFRSLLEVNLVSMFTFSKYSLPLLRRSKGSIVSMASQVATLGSHGSVTYCATKGAMISMTKALALDEAANGVRVNCISPSNIWTEMFRAVCTGEEGEKVISAGSTSQAIGRLGAPGEVAAACLYLAFEASFSTGLDLLVSGGCELGYGYKSRVEQDPHVVFPFLRKA